MVLKFDLSVKSELNTKYGGDADLNELCVEFACGEQKYVCTKLNSRRCCCVG